MRGVKKFSVRRLRRFSDYAFLPMTEVKEFVLKRFILPLTWFAIIAACTPAEDLKDNVLQARLAENVLRFESETDETIVMTLRRNGSGEVRDILEPGRPDRVDRVTWSVQGDELCLQSDGTSGSNSSGRIECAVIEIAGNRVTINPGRSALVGTIAPL